MTFEPDPNSGPAVFDPDTWTGAVVIFEGAMPIEGAPADATVLWTAGSDSAVASILSGETTPLDMRLPLVSPTATTSGEPHGSAWVIMRPNAPALTGQVLVVEDDPNNRAYYVDIISDAGLEAIGVETGRQAINAAAASDFDLIIIDIRLPDANGFELCRTITSMPHVASTPVLLMSADPQLADNDQVIAVGADGFIVNPVAPAVLAEHVVRTARRSVDDQGAAVVGAGADQDQPWLSFFGKPSIRIGSGDPIPLPAGRSTELLATLAAACPISVTAERLARFVWMRDSEISTNAVYTAVSRLRSFLAGIGLPDLVTSEDTGYALNMRPEQIDLSEFEQRARDLMSDPDAAEVEKARELVDRWVAEPFERSTNSLLTRWANRLVETRSRLLELLARRYLFSGDPASCVLVCQELLDEEPWREAVWALRVVALYRSGRANDALQTFTEARDRLRDELGLDPGPTLRGLEVMVLSHDPAMLEDDWVTSLLRGAAPVA